MKQDFYAVIMAGGGGTRLWPLSTREHPKQMLKINGDQTMFQLTVSRLLDLIPYENILVVTTADQAEKLKLQCRQIPDENYLLEPLPRGTASVIGLAAIHLLHRSPDSVMVVLPSDHFIKNDEYFRSLLQNGYQTAQDGHLTTLGIHPESPSTGMGYIEQGAKLAADYELYEVTRFREKPDKETAAAYVASGKFWWNSGMFIWRSDRIMEEIAEFLPDLSEKIAVIERTIGQPDYQKIIDEVWETIVPATVDYGILEKASDVVFLPTHDLGWNDIGSWESVLDVIPSDENGNFVMNCRYHPIESGGTLVCSENSEKLIVTIGVQDMVVIETENAVLVCPRSEAQRVREVVDALKKKGLTAYL